MGKYTCPVNRVIRKKNKKQDSVPKVATNQCFMKSCFSKGV